MIHRGYPCFKPLVLRYQRQSGVRRNWTAALMDDRLRKTGSSLWKYTDKRVLYVGSVLVGAVYLFIIIRVLVSRRPGLVFVAIPLLAVPFAIIFLAIAFVAYTSRRPARPTDEYDRTRFNLFLSSLDALSLGLGIDAPPLVVMGIPFPDSYIIGLGSSASQ